MITKIKLIWHKLFKQKNKLATWEEEIIKLLPFILALTALTILISLFTTKDKE